MKYLKYLKLVAKYVLLPLLFLAAGALIGTSFVFNAGKRTADNASWYDVGGGGLEEEKMIELGGVSQYVRIRSRDLTNPVLLHLHGGPGGAFSAMTWRLYGPLTEYFSLVEWDQRGAGKSAGDASLNETMTYERMVDDAIELIEYLKTRLGVEKVIVWGHSWGSMLGLGVVKKRPDLVHAYVGMGLSLSWRRGFDESRRLLIEAADKAGDKETSDYLTALPDEWPPLEDWKGSWIRINQIQQFLSKYGAIYHAAKNPELTAFPGVFFLDAMFAPNLGYLESAGIAAMLGGLVSGGDVVASARNAEYDPIQALMKDLGRVNLDEDPAYHEFEVPVFVFDGKFDIQTPATHARAWFSQVQAPHKEFITFEHSGHAVITEEPAKLFYSLIAKVRPFALPDSAATQLPPRPEDR